MLKKKPREPSALILQGELFRETERLDEAIASFNKATALAPQRAGPYLARGRIYRLQHKHDLAKQEFEKARAFNAAIEFH